MAQGLVPASYLRALEKKPNTEIELRGILAPMAVNKNTLLYCPESKDVFSLVDDEGKEVFRVDREFGVVDMCYASHLNGFLILSKTPSTLYLLDPSASAVNLQQIKEFKNENVWSLTCYETKLFVSYGDRGSTIEEFDLKDVGNSVKIFTTPTSCQPDQQIEKIRFNSDGNYLGLILCRREKDDTYNRNYPFWFELRRPDDMAVISVVPTRTELGSDSWCWLLSLPDCQFLVTLWRTNKVFLIKPDGTAQETMRYNGGAKYLNSIALLNDKCLVVQTWQPDKLRFHNL